MKKKLLKITLCTIVPILILVSIFLWSISRPPEWITAIIRENFESYTLVARLLHENFQNCGECSWHYYPVRPSLVEGVLIGTHSLENFQRDERDFESELDFDERDAFEIVYTTFRLPREQDRLGGIFVTEDFVVFDVVDFRRQESLIYSVNGNKPQFVRRPKGETFSSIWVTRITGNWFHSRVRIG
jgi:hypothetical protein